MRGAYAGEETILDRSQQGYTHSWQRHLERDDCTWVCQKAVLRKYGTSWKIFGALC
jgi:hypothetical protein